MGFRLHSLDERKKTRPWFLVVMRGMLLFKYCATVTVVVVVNHSPLSLVPSLMSASAIGHVLGFPGQDGPNEALE